MWYQWNALRLQYKSELPFPRRIIDLQDAEFIFAPKSGKAPDPQPRARIVQAKIVPGRAESSSTNFPDIGSESDTKGDSVVGKQRSEL
jgi:hypothetical protein